MLKQLAIFAALLVAGAAFLGVGSYAAKLGVDRSVEKHFFYDARTLSDGSGKYAVPILFPLDFVVMMLLAASLGWAAAVWGPMGLGGAPGYYLILPLCYLAFDFAEDGLLILLLTSRVGLDFPLRVLLQCLTAGKLVAIGLSAAQAAIAGGAALYRLTAG